jgi:anti-sigma-K factor RskA
VSIDPHTDRDRLHDDLAAFALGALDGEEATRLELHIEHCDECRERLGWLRPAVDQLPAAVPQLEPPPRLREGLLATVRAEATPAFEASEAPAREPRRRQRFGILLRPAMAIAAVALIALGVAAGYLARGGDEPSEPASELVAAERLANVPASATLERHGNSATLHVHQLPDLEAGEVYEVWVQRAGVMEPSSTFAVTSDGNGAAAIPGPLDGASAIFVTTEPRGGSQRPTGEPLLKAPL